MQARKNKIEITQPFYIVWLFFILRMMGLVNPRAPAIKPLAAPYQSKDKKSKHPAKSTHHKLARDHKKKNNSRVKERVADTHAYSAIVSFYERYR